MRCAKKDDKRDTINEALKGGHGGEARFGIGLEYTFYVTVHHVSLMKLIGGTAMFQEYNRIRAYFSFTNGTSLQVNSIF